MLTAIAWLVVLAVLLYVFRAVTQSKVNTKAAPTAQQGSAPVNAEVRALPRPSRCRCSLTGRGCSWHEGCNGFAQDAVYLGSSASQDKIARRPLLDGATCADHGRNNRPRNLAILCMLCDSIRAFGAALHWAVMATSCMSLRCSLLLYQQCHHASPLTVLTPSTPFFQHQATCGDICVDHRLDMLH